MFNVVNLTVDKRGITMTQNQFVAICVERTIDPSLALENDDVINAIKSGDIDLLIATLNNQF